MTKPTGKRRGGREVIAPAGSYAEIARLRLPENPDADLIDADLEIPAVLPAALQGVLTELGGADEESKVTVYRIENQNGARKQVWLFESHPNAFNLTDIQERYGEGDYQIVVYGKQEGTNYKIVHANKRITIGPSLNPRPVAAAPAAGVTVHTGAGDNATAKAIADALAGPMTMMAQLVQSMMNNKGGSRAEVLEEVKAMAGLFNNNRPAPSSPMEQIMLFKAYKDLFGGADGKGLDDESGPWAILKSSIDNFGPMLAQRFGGGEPPPGNAEQPAPTGAPILLPTGAVMPAPVAAAPAPENNAEGSQVEIMLKMQLAILLNAAKANSDPALYGSMIYEQAPDEIIDALERGDWFETLVRLTPEFTNYKPWAEAVRKVVLDALGEDARDAANVTGTATGPVARTLTPGAPAGKTVVNAATPAPDKPAGG